MHNDLREILEGLKGYLNYLKATGIEEIPVKVNEFKSLRVDELTPKLLSSITPQLPNSLENILKEIDDCRRCKLWSTRKNIVFGSGNPHAELVFIGEGPGEDEDIQGLPFVGRAGQKLTEIIEKGMKLKRSDVYICNIVKCRPPENREPEADEITACKPFLEKQITVIKPKIIVSLGRPAAATLLNNKKLAISKIRGVWHEYNLSPSASLFQQADDMQTETIRLMPTYHPAYLLRNYTPEVRRQVYEDMKKVVKELDTK